MRTYVPDQRLRGWFLGGPAHPAYVYKGQLAARTLERYTHDLSAVWANVARTCLPGAWLVVRFGMRCEAELGAYIASLGKSPFKLRAMRPAGNALKGRRQAAAFGGQGNREGGRPPAEFDFAAVLA